MAEIIHFADFIQRSSRPMACPSVHTRRPTLISSLRAWHTRMRLRRQLRDELCPCPDTVLKDAGWTRKGLEAELAKPFWRG